MTKLLLLDKDGTLVTPKSGEKFVRSPWDQEPIPGMQEAVRHFHQKGWKIAICSNQGGIAKGHKLLHDTFLEMRFCLELFPEIEETYFCPDFEGSICYRAWADDAITYTAKSHALVCELELDGTFRKPGKGMLLLAREIHGANECWYSGDRPEDEQAADTAGFNFISAHVLRSRFSPGLQELHVNAKQLKFLEGIA